MRWCAEHGLPHSALLAWEPEDRAKLTAWLLEDAQRCTMCGTAPWEWEENPYAYEPVQTTCRGCQLKENAADDVAASARGSRIELVPGRVAERRRRTPRRAPGLRR